MVCTLVSANSGRASPVAWPEPAAVLQASDALDGVAVFPAFSYSVAGIFADPLA